jgi:hypothetical protein
MRFRQSVDSAPITSAWTVNGVSVTLTDALLGFSRWQHKTSRRNSETRGFAGSFPVPQIHPLSPGLPEILGISGVECMLQQLERTRAVKLTTVRVVVVELKVQSSKPAALLLKNQRDEMKLNDH